MYINKMFVEIFSRNLYSSYIPILRKNSAKEAPNRNTYRYK